MRYTPHKYQALATEHILDNPYVEVTNGAGLFLEMGLGKTVSTLTAINELIYVRGEIRKVLIVAPKRVAEHTWKEEIHKWDHLKHLRYSICIGSARKRRAALTADADIYCINRENVPWLVTELQRRWPFDMVVIDESSSFKNPNSARFKAMRMVRPKLKKLVALTGTPAPNNLLDLWSQMYLIDRGERLEKTLGAYRTKYFTPAKRRGDVVYSYDLQKGESYEGEDINRLQIYDKISDVCISMKAKDWLELPPRVDVNLNVYFDADAQAAYDEFMYEAFMALPEGEITALNAAALLNKLLQFCNGAAYGDGRKVHAIHDLKLEALADYIEEAQGHPVLVFYNFQHDVDRITEYFKTHKLPPVHKLGPISDIDDWNAGRFPILLAHPASAGHGLNMQKGGHRIVWFGLPWSLELYQQAVARLDRQGQTKAVLNTHIICPGTVEEKVVAGLTKKAWGQDQLMSALKVEAMKYRKGPQKPTATAISTDVWY